MDCDQIAGLLPWLLNGTLDAAEQQQARAHLATCQSCQRELDETISLWPMFQQHVPAESLIDFAFKRPVEGLAPGLIEEHLARCQECAARFGMARKSRRWVREDGVEAPPPKRKWWEILRQWFATPAASEAMPSGTGRRAIRWQVATLAVGFMALIAVVGWLWSWQLARAWQTSSTEQQQVMRERMSGVDAENQQLRQRQDEANQQIAQLQRQMKETNSPQLNIPVLDVYPTESSARKSGDPPASQVNDLELPRDAKLVTLILNSQNPDVYRSYGIEMLDARNTVKWNAPGLARNPSNDYTISLPAEFLARGESYTINVYGEAKGRRVKVESYRIRVVQSRR